MSENGFTPYRNPSLNQLYNLLFCDDIELFRNGDSGKPQEPWATLLSPDPDTAALRAIADDDSAESRLRVLAFNRLRAAGAPVHEKTLLGVIIEVDVEGALDVLAAFADGRVRYINHSETASIVEEPVGEIAAILPRLFAASVAVVERIGPWEQPRLAPPTDGMVRMSFLVSDGLYFGQGPLDLMQGDAMAGPIIGSGVQLLQAVSSLSRTAAA